LRTSCEACPIGQHNASPGNGCIKCPMGQYAGRSRSISCMQCPPGSIPNDRANDCVACNAGTSSELHFDGNWICEKCLPGRYALEGSDTCQACSNDEDVLCDPLTGNMFREVSVNTESANMDII
jgi:hypothetical protein